jgi:hypothetical protein
MAERRPPDVSELEVEIKRLRRALEEVLSALDDLASIVAAHPEERPSTQYVLQHITHARVFLSKVEEEAGPRATRPTPRRKAGKNASGQA